MGFSNFRSHKMRFLTVALVIITGSVCLAYQNLFAFDLGETPKLGKPVAVEELAKRDSLIFPNGDGLPEGSGNVATGAVLFSQRCVLCHGASGRGGSGEELTGGIADLTRDPPDQTIGTYWPFSTTLFDFIRRAMPMHIPGQLTNNETYALTAYLLYENGILEKNAVLDAQSLAAVEMPNRNGFMWIDVETDGRLKLKNREQK